MLTKYSKSALKEQNLDEEIRLELEEDFEPASGFAPGQDTEETLVERKRRDALDEPKWAAPDQPLSEDRDIYRANE